MPKVDRAGTKRILDVTNGVPLAVKIAADLYRDTRSLESVTESVSGKRTIVDQMVRRYLLHARDSQEERNRLFGLAMLRRADQPSATAAAINLTPEQAKTSYSIELSHLQRRYSFIFTEKEEPALHQEVRSFLRQWLLEHRKDPEVVAVNERLKVVHEDAWKKLEEGRNFDSLQERLEDEEWIGTYLDWTEQQYWFDPVKGVLSLLPFMFAASIYQRDMNEDAATIGGFFSMSIGVPYKTWWTWTTQSLVYTNSQNISQEDLIGLEKLEKITQKRCPTFPEPIPDYQQELRAALWWRLGEASFSKDDTKSLEWYEKALMYLEKLDALKEATARAALNKAYALYQAENYVEAVPIFDRAIELDPNDATAYNSRGKAYDDLEEYQQALQDFNKAIELAVNYASAYNNRGNTYESLEEYQQALHDFDRAIELDPNDATAYYNRGYTYLNLREYQRALQDFDRAIELDPNDASAYNKRGQTYFSLRKYHRALQDFGRAIELDPDYTSAISNRDSTYESLKKYKPTLQDLDDEIKLAPYDPTTYTDRGFAFLELKEYLRALQDFNQAIELAPYDKDVYKNQGLAHLWLKNVSEAKNAFHHSNELDWTDVDSGWMNEWAGMNKQRPSLKTTSHLEAIVEIAQPYMEYVCRGVALGLRGKVKDGLLEMERAIPLAPKQWDAYFWRGMLLAYSYGRLSHLEEAAAAIEQSLKLGLPPILLTPLYWLEKDNPAFFEQYAKPLLEHYEV